MITDILPKEFCSSDKKSSDEIIFDCIQTKCPQLVDKYNNFKKKIKENFEESIQKINEFEKIKITDIRDYEKKSTELYNLFILSLTKYKELMVQKIHEDDYSTIKRCIQVHCKDELKQKIENYKEYVKLLERFIAENKKKLSTSTNDIEKIQITNVNNIIEPLLEIYKTEISEETIQKKPCKHTRYSRKSPTGTSKANVKWVFNEDNGDEKVVKHCEDTVRKAMYLHMHPDHNNTEACSNDAQNKFTELNNDCTDSPISPPIVPEPPAEPLLLTKVPAVPPPPPPEVRKAAAAAKAEAAAEAARKAVPPAPGAASPVAAPAPSPQEAQAASPVAAPAPPPPAVITSPQEAQAAPAEPSPAVITSPQEAQAAPAVITSAVAAQAEPSPAVITSPQEAQAAAAAAEAAIILGLNPGDVNPRTVPLPPGHRWDQGPHTLPPPGGDVEMTERLRKGGLKRRFFSSKNRLLNKIRKTSKNILLNKIRKTSKNRIKSF